MRLTGIAGWYAPCGTPRSCDAPRVTHALFRHQRSDGGVQARFAMLAGRTRVAALQQTAPLRLLLPEPEPDEGTTAAFLNTGGGLAGGDRIAVSLALGDAATLTVATAAAEKVYRSTGDPTRVHASLSLAPAATLAWLPQETILFDGACLDRQLDIAMAADARLLAVETLVFGRAAHGEAITRLRLRERWRLRVAGRWIWADALRLDDASALPDPLGFAGAECMATMLCVAPHAAARLPTLREALPPGLRAGATLLAPGVLLARLLGDTGKVRAAITVLVPMLRSGVLDQPARVPRLWTN